MSESIDSKPAENQTPAGETGPTQGQPPVEETKPAFEPITSQEQLNAVLGDRLARERAKYADYEALKAKAAKLDELEAANKSDLDKAMERNAQLQAELDDMKLADLRREVAADKNLSIEMARYLQGTTREELEASADELAKLVAPKKSAPLSKLAGTVPTSSITTEEQQFLDLLTGR